LLENEEEFPVYAIVEQDHKCAERLFKKNSSILSN
jgi:hypothetical protein